MHSNVCIPGDMLNCLQFYGLAPTKQFSRYRKKGACNGVLQFDRQPGLPKFRNLGLEKFRPYFCSRGFNLSEKKRKMLWTLQICLFCCKNGAQRCTSVLPTRGLQRFRKFHGCNASDTFFRGFNNSDSFLSRASVLPTLFVHYLSYT